MIKTLFLSIWFLAHPVHVSLMSIDYTPETFSFNVFLKIYYDDFLLDSGIKDEDIKKLDFSDTDLFTKEVLDKYIGEKTLISVDDKQLSGKIEKLAMSDNEIRMTISFKSVLKVSTVTVKNYIMTSLYSDQSNMIIVKVNDFEEGFKLTSNETERTFKVK